MGRQMAIDRGMRRRKKKDGVIRRWGDWVKNKLKNPLTSHSVFLIISV